MNINKFVNNTDGSVFHSTGYADIAHGDSIGSTSSQSYRQRQHLERNRQSVKRYGSSMLAGGHMRESARPHFDKTSSIPAREETKPPSRGSSVKSLPRRSFGEPSGRTYNPYS
ncbi:MAG TPA: hypothetical protein VK502_01665 [Candidatus Saccharimonadales bacterium]|nr:hypothetical protein [Candidatus Saccharimonadales bacterium]